MPLSTEDRLAIHELIARLGRLVDAGDFDRLHEIFTADFVYDVQAMGFGVLEGVESFARAARNLGDGNPLGHHVTNLVIVADANDTAAVRSKGLGVMTDGTSGTLTYDDRVRRTADGWRIAHRTVMPRHRPLFT